MPESGLTGIKYGAPSILLGGRAGKGRAPGFVHLHQPGDRVRFGEATITLLGWLLSSAGGHILNTGLEALVTSTQKEATDLQKVMEFQKAQARLSIARKAQPAEQKEYVHEAEKLFGDAALQVKEPYLKAECYKYAAVSARMGERSPDIIRYYVDLALRSRREAIPLIQEMRAVVEKVERARKSRWRPLSYPVRILPELLARATGNERAGQVANFLGGAGFVDEKVIRECRDIVNYYDASDLIQVCHELRRAERLPETEPGVEDPAQGSLPL